MRPTAQDRRIAASFQFLRDAAETGREFSVAELASAAGWTEGNTRTNLSKRLRDFVRRVGRGAYRCDPVILRVTLEEYGSLFRQSNRLFADYAPSLYSDVIVYEFFLPLTHEQRLRDALDDLFYRDRLRRTLREIGMGKIEEAFPREEGETDDELVERVVDRAEQVFGGYSVSHVQGRFRMAELMTIAEAAQYETAGNRYLVDETTAVVRFIAPCPSSQYLPPAQLPLTDPVGAVRSESNEIRWLFLQVFAKALLRVVRQEDEVWLLESGAESGLYIWRRAE